MKISNTFLPLIFIRLVSGDVSGSSGVGFPGGLFNYGDRNHDGQIDESDIRKNSNLAWLMEWHKLLNNVPESVNRDQIISKKEYNNLLGI